MQKVHIVAEYPVADLHLDPGNPRTHPKKQIKQLVAGMRRFGFVSTPLADESGNVIAGHGRVLAARELGLLTIPVMVLTGLSETDKRRLRLSDNRVAQNSTWDDALLRVELQELSLDVSFDLNILGFASAEIDLALKVGGDDLADDIVPLAPAEPKTKPGDIWICGHHRVGCGDARDEAFVRRVMGPETLADVAFLDPPFNVPISEHANRRSSHREFAMASGEMTPEQFAEFLAATLTVGASVSRNGAVHFVVMDWRHADVLRDVGSEIYGDLLNLCVWNKNNAGMGSLYRSKHEFILVFRVGDQKHFNAIQLGRHGRHRSNVWDYASVTSPRGGRRADLAMHPTAKPVAMVADAIMDVSRRNDVVLDLFLGSGTTLIAAERTGRRCRAVEIDPTYVDIALERWTAITGLTPHLARPARRARK